MTSIFSSSFFPCVVSAPDDHLAVHPASSECENLSGEEDIEKNFGDVTEMISSL